MIKSGRIVTVILLALLAAMLAEEVVSQQQASAPTLSDRHHLLYGSVIPPSTEAPDGVPGELYSCLSCHVIDSSSGSSQFVVERDCRACHTTDRHHPLYDTVIPSPTDAPYGKSGDKFNCLSCHGIDTAGGTTDFTVERDCRVCHDASAPGPGPVEPIDLVVDILPESDKNLINLKSKDHLPVWILGSPEYSVTDIDVSSLRLEGTVAPEWWKIRKEKKNGQKVLALKFDMREVRRAIGDLQPGQRREISITGLLKDGTPAAGSDFVVAAPRRKGKCHCKCKGHDD